MGFDVNREIVAGNTLIAEAIQSQNFQAGLTGWAIFADGSYEFGSGGTFRGDVSISGADGSKIMITADNGAEIDLYPQTEAGVTVNAPGRIFANTEDFGGGAHATFISFNSAEITDANGMQLPASLFMGGPISDGTPYPGFFTQSPLLEFNGDIQGHGGLVIDDFITVGPDNTDIGRGINTTISAITSSTASGTEVIVLGATGYTFRAGRAYSIEMGGGAASSVAGTVADFRIKKTASGVITATEFGEFYRYPLTVASAVFGAYGKIFVKNNTTADITTDFALTLQSATNTVFHVAGTGRQRYMTITDVGLAVDSWFTNATVVS